MARSTGVVVRERENGGFERYLGGKSTEVVGQVDGGGGMAGERERKG